MSPAATVTVLAWPDAGLLEVRREVLDATGVDVVASVVGPVWREPLEPDGGSRFPWKSLNDRIWIGNCVLPGRLARVGPRGGCGEGRCREGRDADACDGDAR